MIAIAQTTAMAAGLFPGINRSLRGSSERLMASRLFQETVLPHLDAGFKYAGWLTRNDSEAEDVVQDACLRAMRFFSSLRDNNARAWLLTIVRNSWYSRVSRRKEIPESTAGEHDPGERPDDALDPQERLLQQYTVARVRSALEQLPLDFPEAIVLRDTD